MNSYNDVADKIESQAMMFSEDAVGEAMHIEAVLGRAHEIHRARSGLFGYDLEDWLEAERELAERNLLEDFHLDRTGHAESLPLDQKSNLQKCFGLSS